MSKFQPSTVYNAEISAGSLMLPESRRIATLLLTHPSKEDWSKALKLDNILQKKSPATAIRQARLIRSRLDTLDEHAWEMVATGEQEVAVQMLLAAAIKHSRLLGDFMRDVVGGRMRRLESELSPKDWETFLTECAQRDPTVRNWSETTKAKLLQVIIRILAESKYLESTRFPRFRTPSVHPTVAGYLRQHGEQAVLAAMELKA